MKRLMACLSLWHLLLACSLTIMAYLIVIQSSEALSYDTMATYFKEQTASLEWAPSKGPVDHYQIEITDTHLFSDTVHKNALTRVWYATTQLPFYELSCEHNHSYQVRVKAVSPEGFSSAYSEPSVLFICDQKKPELQLPPFPDPYHVRSRDLLLTGQVEEGNLDCINVNGKRASFNTYTNNFESTVTLEAGDNRIRVTARDRAGNSTTALLDVTYDPSTRVVSPGNAYYHPFIADYNRDGRKDLLIGTEDGRVALFTNTGTVTSPNLVDHGFLKAEEDYIDVGTHAAPFLVDYNNDGHQDLLVGTGSGHLLCYLNQGGSGPLHFTSPVTIQDTSGKALAVEGYCTPWVTDWNGDNKKDILLGSGAGRVVVYPNEGSDADPLFSSPLPVAAGGVDVAMGGPATPLITDWDGDGGKDLLVRDQKGGLYLFLNSVVSGEPDFLTAETVQEEDQELMVERFPLPNLTDWDQVLGHGYLFGSSDGHLYRPL